MQIIDFVAQVPLFRGLPKEQLAALARIAASRSYARGQTVFTEGEEADGFYVLTSGRVKIYKLSWEGKEQILHLFEAGEPFGEVPVFTGGRFPAHAEVLEKSEAIFFARDAFRSLVKSDPTIALNMLAILSIRLKHFARLIEDLSLKEVPQRLAAHLLYLSNTSGGKDEVELDVSKGQLASLLGTIPETLSRVLGKMSAAGLIDVQGRQIRLLDRKGLAEAASGRGLL